MKVAIVHHWFVTKGGGERVVSVLADMFPDADIFTLVATPEGLPANLAARSVTASVLQKLPGATRIHRHLFPLYPFAVEQLDLTSYDLVLTSDSGPMKGVITRPDAVQVCYCHSPMRYLWDSYHSYTSSMRAVTRLPFSIAAHYVRSWDYIAAQRVTHFIANSRYVAKRIEHYYGRESSVVYPPVDVRRGIVVDGHGDHYLAAGRLVSYKRTDLLIEACNRLGRRLRVIGSGPELNRLKRLAGPTIEFQSEVSTDELWQNYAQCRALLFAADEDFGMIPVEAQACGRPVIAFGKGGALETVRGASARNSATPMTGATGVFFQQQTPEQVMQAIVRFESLEDRFSPTQIQKHASQFNTPVFVKAISSYLIEIMPAIHDVVCDTISEPAA